MLFLRKKFIIGNGQTHYVMYTFTIASPAKRSGNHVKRVAAPKSKTKKKRLNTEKDQLYEHARHSGGYVHI